MHPERDDAARAPHLELRDVLDALARRKAVLVVGLVLGLGAAWAVHRAIPPRYTATSILLVESKEAPEDFVRTPVTDSMRDRIQTLNHRLTSDETMRWLLEEVDPAQLPGTTPEGRIDGVRKHLELEIVNAASRDDAVLALSFTAKDPEVAARVVESLTRRLVDERTRERTTRTAATLESLDREVARMRDELAVEAERIDLALQERMTGVRGTDAATLEERRDQRRAELSALQRLREEVAQSEATYTPRHPKVLQLRAQFEELRKRLTAPVALLAAPGNDGEIENLPLLRDYQSKLEGYEALLGRQIEASMAYDLERKQGGGELQVLRAARRPHAPTWPDPLLVGFAGGSAGLLAASLLVLWPVLRRPAFGSVDRLAQISGLPVVAATPRLRARRTWRRSSRLGVDSRIVVASDPASVAAEQYRSFLPYLREAGDSPVVLVTSADRGEGKSLSAANFAASAALDAQRRVLLIDADLRRPSAHRLLHARRSPGLSDVIHRGNLSIESCAVATRISNLFLLPSGTPVANPLQMLTRDSFLELIAQARRDFDAVFVDTPPLLPVVDTRIVERVASTILFVVRADATPRQTVLRSLREIRGPVGVVFTGVSAYSYRRYYGTDPDARAYELPERSRA